MSLKNCHNFEDFRNLAKKRLPSPIFHYIDGAADDEITYKRNTDAYEQCDLIPNVLSGVDKVDMSTTVMGQKLDMPLYCAPTALQRLFHHEGEIGVAKAAEKFGKGEEIEEFKPSGASEIRQAGLEFDRMRKRILRHLNQRSEMLSGISHDLRTPLTRMKLQLALIKDKNLIDRFDYLTNNQKELFSLNLDKKIFILNFLTQ